MARIIKHHSMNDIASDASCCIKEAKWKWHMAVGAFWLAAFLAARLLACACLERHWITETGCGIITGMSAALFAVLAVLCFCVQRKNFEDNADGILHGHADWNWVVVEEMLREGNRDGGKGADGCCGNGACDIASDGNGRSGKVQGNENRPAGQYAAPRRNSKYEKL